MSKEVGEVVPSGKALALVKKWMAAFDDNGEPEELPKEPELRPMRLGLGAKFVPHSQVMSTMNPLEKKLRAKIESSRRATAGTESTSGKSENLQKGSHGRSDRAEADEESSEEDEESRAAAFGKRSKVDLSERKTVGVPSNSLGVHNAKKRRRKKKKGGSGNPQDVGRRDLPNR